MKTIDSIGVFDSGIGGLSIARKIRERLPNENLVYVADTHHAPYGEKSEDFILQRSHTISGFLVERGAKAIVVACNTATTAVINELRSHFNVPIIGVEPGIKPAIINTKSGVVGVLATTRTLATNSFNELVSRLAGSVEIEIQPSAELVPLVESLRLSGEDATETVKRYVLPLLEKGADHIVLGCTHYNHLADLIAEVAGPDIHIINTSAAVAEQVVRRLEHAQLSDAGDRPGRDEFWSSGDLDRFQQQVVRLWGEQGRVFRLAS